MIHSCSSSLMSLFRIPRVLLTRQGVGGGDNSAGGLGLGGASFPAPRGELRKGKSLEEALLLECIAWVGAVSDPAHLGRPHLSALGLWPLPLGLAPSLQTAGRMVFPSHGGGEVDRGEWSHVGRRRISWRRDSWLWAPGTRLVGRRAGIRQGDVQVSGCVDGAQVSTHMTPFQGLFQLQLLSFKGWV